VWPTQSLADRIVEAGTVVWAVRRVHNEIGDVGQLPAR